VARHCTICSHPDRHAVDLRLASPDCNLSALARDLGLTRNAVARHRDNHLAQQRVLLDLTAEADALSQGAIHAQAQALYLRSLEVLADLESGEIVGHDDAGQPIRRRSIATQLKAIREVRANVELLARLTLHGSGPTVEAERVDIDSAIERALRRAEERRALPSGDDSVVEAEILED
jgi:hypothetical protein